MAAKHEFKHTYTACVILTWFTHTQTRVSGQPYTHVCTHTRPKMWHDMCYACKQTPKKPNGRIKTDKTHTDRENKQSSSVVRTIPCTQANPHRIDKLNYAYSHTHAHTRTHSLELSCTSRGSTAAVAAP
eukprot:GDKI01007229.1.p1 GENE.GDKI01007229.1~~GDKI01007229.1.p1  ORF type:complete len:129 (+),score=13.12 GDKI01007229.1:139-525(+)